MTTAPAERAGTALQAIEERIQAACERSGRPRSDVTLIGVSKVQPIEKIQALHDVGLGVFGENRVQEALSKAPELPDSIDWHLIGPLQSNKVRKALQLFGTIHSVDRLKIARVIDRIAGELSVRPTILLEVNVGSEGSKHGFTPEEVEAQAEELASFEHLAVQGLMAIPPFDSEAEATRPWFIALRRLRDRLSELDSFPGWRGALSMGMSNDFEVAIEEGATHVRVGTALFGRRQPATSS